MNPMLNEADKLYVITPTIADPTPATTGPELLSDPDLENEDNPYPENPALSGKYLCPCLTAIGTPDYQESADAYSGVRAQQFTAGANAELLRFANIVAPPAGTWYQFSGWGKRTAGANSKTGIKVWQSAGMTFTQIIDAAAYTQYLFIIRTLNANTMTFSVTQTADATYDTVVVDDFSRQALSLASLLEMDQFPGAINVQVSAGLTRATCTQAGVAVGWNDAATPTYGVIGYLDGGANAILAKCVNGTWTNVITGAVTYGAAKVLQVRRCGSAFSLWYDGAPVGGVATISDVGNYTYHGKFSTLATNTFANMKITVL